MRTALHAYINHVSVEKLKEALFSVVQNLEYTKTETFSGNYVVQYFENKYCGILLHLNPDICWSLEVEIKGDISNTEYSGINNIQFGEKLVYELGCEAIVDCEGEINPVHSDRMVRITKNRWESVEIPDEGEKVNESTTKEIHRQA